MKVVREMKKDRIRALLSMLFNLLAAILTAVSIASFFTAGGEGNMAVAGTRCFIYFTIDSNILAALTCLLMVPYDIRMLKNGDEFPRWTLVCKFIGTSAVTLTLLVVLLYLGPTMGYPAMFAGKNLYLHLICPLLAIVSYVFFEHDGSGEKRSSLPGVIPTFIYANVYLVMVIVIGKENGGWADFYGFNLGGMWPLFYIGLNAFSYGISVCLNKLNAAFASRAAVKE